MGFLTARRGIVLLALSGTLILGPLSPAVNAAPESPPDPIPVSDAAAALADIRADRKEAEARAAEAEVRAGDAAARLGVAQDAVAAAAAVDRDTEAKAAVATSDARKATAAETKARDNAREAEAALSRMARNAYINAMADSDLELFASFAADGPEALNALARRDMAYDNLGDASLVDAQRTVKVATDAGVLAQQKQTVSDAATADYQRAHDTLVAARREVSAAERERAAATSDIRAANADAAKTDARYDKAQEVYKVSLEKSLAESGSSAPISQGPAADVVWKMFKAEGFSEESIAGILGNLQQESGVDPTAVQAGGPGRGLAQWSMGGRWDNGSSSLISFASSQGLDPWSARTQVQFMLYEMQNVLSFDVESFKDMTDILAATVYFHDVFEGSADSADFVRAVRGNYALQWYARLS